MIGVYLYDIFGASAGNKSSHPKTACNAQTGYKSKKMNPDNWIICRKLSRADSVETDI